MCIIAVKPEGKELFPEKTIERMFAKNPDGAGFMFFNKETGKVEAHKGFFSCKKLINALNEVKDLKDTNAILHFRIGTSGKMDDLNCHPYPVYDENGTDFETDLAVAHNGVLREYTPAFGSEINDTQTFIRKVLRNLSPDFINDSEKLFLIKQILGTNKLAFIDKDNHITMLGDFIEDSGYFYSNYSYKEPEQTKYYQKPLWSDYYLDNLSSSCEQKDENEEIKFKSLNEMIDYMDCLDRVGNDYYDGEFCYVPDYRKLKLKRVDD